MPGQKGEVDKNGVVTWTVPYFVEDLSEVFVVGEDPPVDGMKEISRSWTDIEGAGLQVEVQYEGVIGDPEDKEDTYDYDSSFKEETLLAHPEWRLLKNVFKGRYDKEEKKIEFPEFLKSNERGLGSSTFVGPPAPGDQPKGIKNPMYGLETFLSLSSVFRHTYVRSEVSASLFNRIGSIRESLPGGFPTPSGRNWIVMPPKISQRGSVYQITEEYMLSQPGGWPEKVYKLIQL